MAQTDEDAVMIRRISDEILTNGKAYDLLHQLTKQIGGRLAGSPQFAKAVQWGKTVMEQIGDPLVHLVRNAIDHGLEPAIEEALGWANPGHINQTGESDGHLLTRLGRQFDAIATIKAGRLLFMPIGKSRTAGGTALPGITIARQDGDSHTYQNLEGNSDYSGVKANWYDVATAVTQTVLAEDDNAEKFKTLLEMFSTEEEARNAANAEWNRIKRGRFTMSLTLALGQPTLLPETPVALSGWSDDITAHAWICGPVEHTLNGSGLVTKVELENAD